MVEEEKALVSPSSQDTNTIIGGCSDLNEKSPHRHRPLNTQTPGGGIVCRCLGGVSRWRKYVSGVGFENIQPHCTSSLLFVLSACAGDVVSKFPALAALPCQHGGL